MHNWSVDTKELKKHREQYNVWRLEQMINFGLGKEKLKKQELKKYWPLLYIDPDKKRFLNFLLWPKEKF